MIPVRVRADSSITTTGGIRPPMSPDHPLASTPCPVCDGPLTGEPITLVVVGIDPETRAEGKTWCTGAAVAVHAACAGVAPEPSDGEHGTCAICGGQTRYQAAPGGGWWVHDAHPADGHDARLGGPA